MNRLITGLLCAAATGLSLPAWPADTVTDALQQAYEPYRTALFRTNGKVQAEAEQAVTRAQQAWLAFGQQVGAKPPAPYAHDAGFTHTVQQVAALYEKAAAEVHANQLPAAHETLEGVRDALADLRKRNAVVVYSDHMNAYHAEMEQVLNASREPFTSQQDWMLLMALVGVLDYLAARLRSDAPAPLLGDADFDAHLKAVQASVARVRAAALAQDSAALGEAIGKLKLPYSRMFLKYG